MDSDPALPVGMIKSMLRLVNRHLHKCRHRQHRLVSFLFKGGNLISIGFNFGVTHAECTAINHAWRSKDSLIGTTMFVVRVRRDGTMGLSKPCINCMARLNDTGVRRVVYTDNNGQFQIVKLPVNIGNRINPRLQNIIWHKKAIYQ